ncbi:MAG TPA: hypothetical protein VGH64_11850 [Puia sp.]
MHFRKPDHVRDFNSDVSGLNEIVKPVPLIPNGGIWYQMVDIQLHIRTENEINTSKGIPI